MKINSKIFRRKSGKSAGKWIVRVSYLDEVLGKTVQKERLVDRKNKAADVRNEMVRSLQDTNGQLQSRMTFNRLADVCEDLFYRPAVIGPDGKKLSGVRSVASARAQIKNLRDYFGNQLVRQITYEELLRYREHRMLPRAGHRPVKLATVNREFQTLRRMLRFAKSKDWIAKNVFADRLLIESSAETARTRLLSKDEEDRLLAACSGTEEITYQRTRLGRQETLTVDKVRENPRLKAILLLAIDSGMRRGEILKLRWSDIDFKNALIQIIGTHTKTEKPRIAPLSDRTKDALLELQLYTSGERPFPISDFKNAFTTAKRRAGIEDLRFHDLRRTAITRWIAAGTPLAEAGKFAGHAKPETTVKHYVATDMDAVKALNNRINSREKGIVDVDTTAALEGRDYIN
jgi:integrase